MKTIDGKRRKKFLWSRNAHKGGSIDAESILRPVISNESQDDKFGKHLRTCWIKKSESHL